MAYERPEGLPFRPGSMTWQVNMEPIIGLGGGRALLLQVLHPLVAAGVEQHSTFEQDPFRRGFRTADMMLKIAFAEPSVSQKQAGLLRKMHEKVKGVSSDGVAYNAMDPTLLLWVWATLVEVSLLMYERGVRPLSDVERDRYYEEQKLVAAASGIPSGVCPETYDDFVKYFEHAIDEDLRVTKTARIVAFAGGHPPLPFPLRRLGGFVGTFFTAALLPERFRDALGYEWSPARERALRAFFLASRAGSRILPSGLRRLPNRYLTKRKTPLGWWRHRRVDVPDEITST